MRQYVTSLAAQKGLSIKALSEKLGYRSRTSLVRLMDQPVTEKTLGDFSMRVIREFSLTEKEAEVLYQATVDKRFGPERAATLTEMLRLVAGEEASEDEEILLEDWENGKTVSLSALLAGMKAPQLLILNSSRIPMYRMLEGLLKKPEVRISHFTAAQGMDKRVTKALRQVTPLLFYTGYEFFFHRLPESGAMPGIWQSDLMLVSWQDEGGEERHVVIMFDGLCHGRLTVLSREDRDRLRWMLNLWEDSFVPLKNRYDSYEDKEDYLTYMRRYTELEKNREVYMLRPDPSISFIPVDTLVSALRQGVFPPEVLKSARMVFEQRNRNIYQKKQDTWLLMDTDAVRRFAQSGKTTEHFWGLRPFTPRETADILRLMAREGRARESLHIHLLKPGFRTARTEMVCYGEAGMLIAPDQTDYHLENGCPDVILTDKLLLSSFRRLMREFFCFSCAFSREETADRLEALAEEAERRE